MPSRAPRAPARPARAEPATAPARRHARWGWPALVLVLVAAAHAPGLSAGYLDWDDTAYIRDNPHLRLPDGLFRIWLTREASQYYPVTFTSFWLESRLWGTEPRGYHAANLALHLLNVVLLVRVARGLGLAAPLAWLAGALFGVHPVNVASVAWLAERKNLLSAAGALVTVLLYLRYLDSGRRVWVGAAALAWAFALLSKTAVAPLPVMLPLAARWILRQRGARAWWPILPLLALSIAAALLTILEEREVPVAAAPLPLRLLVAAAAPWYYVGKLVWPACLVPVYGFWYPDPAVARWWFAPVAWLVLLVGLGLARRRAAGPVLWCAFTFVLLLAPVLHIVPFHFGTFSPVADHFLYLPGALFLLGLGFLVARLSPGAPRPADPAAAARTATAVRATWVVAGLVLLLLAGKTWVQTRRWQDPVGLWAYNVARVPDSAGARFLLGSTLAKRGDYAAARQHLEEALRLRPDYLEALDTLGVVFDHTGQPAIAVALWRRAVQLGPHFGLAHVHLALALVRTGQAADVAEAVRHARRAVQLSPQLPDAHAALGAACEQQGDMAAALPAYQRALALGANHAVLHNGLGRVLATLGRVPEAVEHFRRAVAQDPNYVIYRANLARALRDTGQLEQAAGAYRGALQLAPQDWPTVVGYSRLLVQMGNTADARRLLTEALQHAAARNDPAAAQLARVLGELP